MYAPGLVRELISLCDISAAWDPQGSTPAPDLLGFRAIWDTGATHSVISPKVVMACNLKSTGRGIAHYADGSSKIVQEFLVNIGLPNEVVFSSIRVTLGGFTGGDVLIGMDIISQGDFAVTNFNQKTVFSFRAPSREIIDFAR